MDGRRKHFGCFCRFRLSTRSLDCKSLKNPKKSHILLDDLRLNGRRCITCQALTQNCTLKKKEIFYILQLSHCGSCFENVSVSKNARVFYEGVGVSVSGVLESTTVALFAPSARSSAVLIHSGMLPGCQTSGLG